MLYLSAKYWLLGCAVGVSFSVLCAIIIETLTHPWVGGLVIMWVTILSAYIVASERTK